MQISSTHATKACAHLAASRWLDADRGRGGGLEADLAPPPTRKLLIGLGALGVQIDSGAD